MNKFLVKGDPDEYGDWLLLIFPLNGTDINSLNDALNELILTTSDMDALLSYKMNEEDSWNYLSSYIIQFRVDGQLIEEEDFFKICCKHNELQEYISKYINNVNQDVFELKRDNPSSYPQDNWQDEYHPRGSYAIVPLVLENELYARQFGKLFEKWDMGNEIWQGDLVEVVMKKYGITPNTLPLFVLRNINDGQSTEENNLRILYGLNLKEQLDTKKFIQCVIYECQDNPIHWECVDMRLVSFAMIYAGESEKDYIEICKYFSREILSADDSPFAVADATNGMIGDLSDEFISHRWLHKDTLYQDLPCNDWFIGVQKSCVLSYLLRR